MADRGPAGGGCAGRGRPGRLLRAQSDRHGSDGGHDPFHAHLRRGRSRTRQRGRQVRLADDQSRGTGLALRAYEIEVRFYREVAARVGARVPATYVAEVEPETGWFTLLLQDIAGAVQGDQIAACGPDVAAAVLEEMAGLHAPCLEDPDLARAHLAQPCHARVGRLPRRARGVAAARLPRALRRHPRAEHPRGLPALLPAPARVPAAAHRTTHGQPRRFPARQPLVSTGEPEAGRRRLADGCRAGASLDVAYFIGGCLSTEDRRAHEQDLLSHYHDALRRGGVSDYSLEQLRADTRLDTFGGVLMAIVAAMVVQRTERGDLMFLTSTTRHAQHALDVDAPALLLAAG